MAGGAGYIDLGGRLGERKEARSKTHLGIGVEELMQAQLKRSFEIGKGDSLVDDEPLHLREHRRMRRIVGVAAIDASRCNHADWRIRLILLHRTCLYRRCLRTQEYIFSDIE